MKKNMLIVGMLCLGLTVLTVQTKTGAPSAVVSASAVVESALSQLVPSRPPYLPHETFMEAIVPDKFYQYIMSLTDLWKRVQNTPLSEPAFFIGSEKERAQLLKDILNRYNSVIKQ